MQTRQFFSCTALVAVSFLCACSGGGTDAPTVTPMPTWSAWTSVDGIDAAFSTSSGHQSFADPSGTMHILGSKARGNEILEWTYSPTNGWGAPVKRTEATTYPQLYSASKLRQYAGGVLLETADGDALYDFQSGWGRAPTLPGATRLALTVAPDGGVIGSRMVGGPSTNSTLELFDLKQSSWSLRQSFAVQPVALASSSITPVDWRNVVAYVYKGGMVAKLEVGVLPQLSSRGLDFEIATDTGASGALLPTGSCSVSAGGDCYTLQVLPNGELYGHASYPSRGAGYYKRESGKWLYGANGSPPGAPMADLISPLFSRSDTSELFSSRCLEGVGLCEGDAFVRFVDRASGVTRSAVGVGTAVLSEGGTFGLLPVGVAPSGTAVLPWQISYRQARREYSEPAAFTTGNLLNVRAFDSGPNRQYVVADSVNVDGSMQLKVFARSRS